MKDEYDLSTMKSRKNPYAAKLKKPVTIRLSDEVLSYFKQMAKESGIPYQSLINLYLRDCVIQQRKMAISWQGITPPPQ
jgi:predicted DNA binding CopG/RHH family protein